MGRRPGHVGHGVLVGTVVSPNPGQVAGQPADTRRPAVATTEPGAVDGIPAWDTSRGAVFLVLGGGETTITLQYFAIPAVSNETGAAHVGTTTLPTVPFETFAFGCGDRRRWPPRRHDELARAGNQAG